MGLCYISEIMWAVEKNFKVSDIKFVLEKEVLKT
jgi:hypothetical protein